MVCHVVPLSFRDGPMARNGEIHSSVLLRHQQLFLKLFSLTQDNDLCQVLICIVLSFMRGRVPSDDMPRPTMLTLGT
jgi:hypothetical protein